MTSETTGRALPQLTGDDAPCTNLCYCERAANLRRIREAQAKLVSMEQEINRLRTENVRLRSLRVQA